MEPTNNPFAPLPHSDAAANAQAGPAAAPAQPAPTAPPGAASIYSQQVLEAKDRELRELVLRNFSRIHEVTRELQQLQQQVQMTSGPKRQALELMRRKIEAQNEKCVAVRARHSVAKAAFDLVDAELQGEEAEKTRLCDELNILIQSSTELQLQKMEELRVHLTSLNVPSHAPAAAAA
ncbi:hypothetical protein FOA52_013819, partial [Chlamydomonas sp. UWO 241]